MAHRANVAHYTVEGCGLLLNEDHRMLLNVLYHARRSGWLTRPPLLVYFDHHDDATRPSCNPDQLRAFQQTLPDPRKFWSFVEWDISDDDDDWLLTGME